MKKVFIFIILLFIYCGYCFPQNVEVTVSVSNIKINGGKVYLVLFNNANSFANENPDFYYELSDKSTSAVQTVSVPPGDYVVTVFQDANNNQKLDKNLIGKPTELMGISNYNGKGFPARDFNKQKIRIDSTTGRLTLPLYKL